MKKENDQFTILEPHAGLCTKERSSLSVTPTVLHWGTKTWQVTNLWESNVLSEVRNEKCGPVGP